MSAIVGLTGRVATVTECRDELEAIKSLVRLMGAVTSSDLGRDVWGEGVAYLAQYCCHAMDRVDTVLEAPEEDRRS